MKSIRYKSTAPGSSRGRILALILFTSLLISSCIYGDEIPGRLVASAVQTWVQNFTSNSRPEAVIEWMEPYRIEGRTLAYIAHLQDSGYCLCGADDMLLPVYAYFPNGSFDANNPDLQYFIESIAEFTLELNNEAAENTQRYTDLLPVFEDRAEYWEDLIDDRFPTRRHSSRLRAPMAAPDSMSLHQTTLWDQPAPYNNFCPLLPTTTYRTIVGCNAISQSQIMKYWDWPTIGTGVDTGYYEYYFRTVWDEEPLATNPGFTTPGGWCANRIEYDTLTSRLRMNGYWDYSMYLSAIRMSDSTGYRAALDSLFNRMGEDTVWFSVDYGASTYQWDLMKDTPAEFTSAGTTAVATLCYHAAVSCITNFHVFVSTTNHGLVVSALEDHFFYDNDATFSSAAPTVNRMVEEIQYLRPFAIGGTDTAGRGTHSWIVIGYDQTGADPMFKMNLGWGGRGDGWFVNDTVSTWGFVFATNNTTWHIAPNNVKFLGNASGGDGSPDSPFLDMDGALAIMADNQTLIIKAGETAYFEDDSLVINRPITIKSRDGTIDQY